MSQVFTLFQKKPFPFAVVFLTILVCVCYTNSLKGEFIWDDDLLIKDNRFIKQFKYLPQLFITEIGAGAHEKYRAYRPLQMISYMLDYKVWRLNPVGYHITSIAWHLVAAVGVFGLIRLLCSSDSVALLTAALFAAHPVHTEAVSYISGRSDLLASAFMLITMMMYWRWPFQNQRWKLFFLFAVYAGALLSRENALILPVLILAMHGILRQRVRMLPMGLLLVMAIGYALLRLTVLRSLLIKDDYYATALQLRIPGAFSALYSYLKLIIWPADLHMEYGQRIFSWMDSTVISGVGLFLGMMLLGVALIRRNPLLSIGISWFIISLFPVLNIFPVNAYMAEHWVYFPSIGFFFVLAQGFHFLIKSARWRVYGVCLCAILLVFSVVRTIKQNAYWRAAKSLYERTLRYCPQSARVYNNLGIIYKQEGNLEKAEQFCRKALAIDSCNVDALFSLGNIYYQKKDYSVALEIYSKVLVLDPAFSDVYVHRGNAYYYLGDSVLAEQDYRRALVLEPDNADAINNLGALIQSESPGSEDALRFYTKAIELDPHDASGYTNLGGFYMKSGKYDQAISMFHKATEVEPDDAPAYNLLGTAYLKIGRISEAEEAYNRSLSVDPSHAQTYFNRGNLYQQQGFFDQAAADYENALRLNPDYLSARHNLGTVYHKQGRLTMAIDEYRKVYAADSNDEYVMFNLATAYQANGAWMEAHALLLKLYRSSASLIPKQDILANLLHVAQQMDDDVLVERYRNML